MQVLFFYTLFKTFLKVILLRLLSHKKRLKFVISDDLIHNKLCCW